METNNTILRLLKSEIKRRISEESIPRIIQCLNELDQSEIWFKPNENSNSVGNLVLHLCGNLRQYFLSAIDGQKDSRERDSEFSDALKFSKEELIDQLNLLDQQLLSAINNVSLEKLTRDIKVQGFDETGMSIIIHVIEHFSYHTGQIVYATKWLKNIDTGFYKDFDLNITS